MFDSYFFIKVVVRAKILPRDLPVAYHSKNSKIKERLPPTVNSEGKFLDYHTD